MYTLFLVVLFLVIIPIFNVGLDTLNNPRKKD